MNNSWNEILNEARENLSKTKYLIVENYKIKLCANDQSILGWVGLYLAPLAKPLDLECDDQHDIVVSCLYLDSVVSLLISSLNSDSSPYTKLTGYAKREMYITEDDSRGIRICISPEEGIVWVIDRTNNTMAVVYSSRTYWPSLEFARSVRDVITHYLKINGWFLCHAGAVATAKGNLMILGGPGAGKTTLIFALLESGAHYVANELLFARPCEQGLEILPFSIPIAIGLGTALQFKELIAVLDKPYASVYPPRRLNTVRLGKSDHNDWLRMKDKLQLLPSELTAIFPSSKLEHKVLLDRILVPRVFKSPTKQKSTTVTSEAVSALMSNNIISFSDKKFSAPWLQIGSSLSISNKEESLLASVKALPVRELEFYVCENDNKIDLESLFL